LTDKPYPAAKRGILLDGKLRKIRRLGIMGGTFDPIHYGHLVAAETARSAFALEQVLFIPTGNPPHKVAYKVTDAWERFHMVASSIQTNDRFQVSSLEIEREGPSYTIDTLRTLRELLPEQELYFITGADALRDILSWRQPAEIIKLATIIAASRPGYSLDELLFLIGENAPRLRNRIFQLEIPALAISSTDIRRRVREGLSIRYLLPDKVRLYIEQEGLYRNIEEEAPCPHNIQSFF